MRACQDLSSSGKASRGTAASADGRAAKARFTRAPPRAAGAPIRSLQLGRSAEFGLTPGSAHVRPRDRGLTIAHAFAISDRQFGRHRADDAWSAQRRFDRLERVGECIVNRGSLKPAVSHAVIAGGVAADAVLVPL